MRTKLTLIAVLVMTLAGAGVHPAVRGRRDRPAQQRSDHVRTLRPGAG